MGIDGEQKTLYPSFFSQQAHGLRIVSVVLETLLSRFKKCFIAICGFFYYIFLKKQNPNIFLCFLNSNREVKLFLCSCLGTFYIWEVAGNSGWPTKIWKVRIIIATHVGTHTRCRHEIIQLLRLFHTTHIAEKQN